MPQIQNVALSICTKEGRNYAGTTPGPVRRAGVHSGLCRNKRSDSTWYIRRRCKGEDRWEGIGPSKLQAELADFRFNGKLEY